MEDMNQATLGIRQGYICRTMCRTDCDGHDLASMLLCRTRLRAYAATVVILRLDVWSAILIRHIG